MHPSTIKSTKDHAQFQPVKRTTTLAPRSWLFVPASRPDRFIKALNTSADAVIIDLEDAVDPAEKDQARANVVEFFANELGQINHDTTLKGATQKQVWIRLNNDEQLEEDLVMCGQLPNIAKLAGVLLPKVAAADAVAEVSGTVAVPVVAQIESAIGFSSLAQIAQADGLYALSFGRLDICNELNIRAGSRAEDDLLTQLRVQMLIISKANNLSAPIESIYADFKDIQGLSASASYANDLGFSGMLCIHPEQIAVIHKAFAITSQQQQFAHKVVTQHNATKEHIFAIDGVMVDLPVIIQSQRIVDGV